MDNKIIIKIKNKEELNRAELMMVERGLKMLECYDMMLNIQLDLLSENDKEEKKVIDFFDMQIK